MSDAMPAAETDRQRSTPTRTHAADFLRYLAARRAAAQAPAVAPGLIAVAPGELTCTRCGETFPPTANGENPNCHVFCWRCGCRSGVRTVAYLREGEYEVVR